MEATGEDLTLLHKITPPRLEDAGLEDCALPPDSIKEAFLKAASSVGSRAASIFAADDDDLDGGCISDPWTQKTAPSDTLVGIEPEKSPPGPCTTVRGGALVGDGESASDVVVVGERNEEDMEKKDEVVVVGDGEGGEDGGDCVDGLRGLEIKEKKEKKEDQEKDEKKPTLIEGYFLSP